MTVGYVPLSSVLLAIAWLAAAAQLAALAFGRYAPYAGGVEPPPAGLGSQRPRRSSADGRAARLGQVEVAHRCACRNLAGAAGDVDERVRGSCTHDHVRLLAGHGLEDDALFVEVPSGAEELVTLLVSAKRRLDSPRVKAGGGVGKALKGEQRGTNEHERPDE